MLDAVALRPNRASTVRFAILQALSIVIAVMGLTTNSAAVVIGAMLVAPLMGPIMGISASLAMGWGARALRTAALVSVAAGSSIVLAYLLSALVPGDGITDEVLARTAPGATDLVIALAAGLAGAYATVRPEISSSLPGVAVAVALVPPLATIGITWQAGQTGLAAGALLLFVTNLAAIVFGSLLVFPLTGFVPPRRMKLVKGKVAVYAVAVTVVVLALTALLTNRTIAVANQADDVASARRLATSWLSGTGLELTSLSVDDNRVVVAVAGPNAPPEPTDLAGQLDSILGAPAELEIQWLQRSSIAANGTGLTNLNRDTVSAEAIAWLAETGQDPSAFDLDIDLGPRSVTVTVAGPVAPPDQRSLERRLTSRLGITIPVTVDATVTVPDAETRDELDTAINTATEWAVDRDLAVASVSLEGDIATVVIEGPEPPTEAATLSQFLATDLGRPIELVLRYRTATTVPTDPVPEYRWPLDCQSRAVTPPVVAPTPGFTTTPLGAWLAGLLAGGPITRGPITFVDDGSTFAQDFVDGALHLWAAPPRNQPDEALPDIRPTGGGPRPAEVRVAAVGGVSLFLVVAPHDIGDAGTGACLPATSELDAWFEGLIASAAAAPFTGSLEGYGPAAPNVETPTQHLLAVAVAARLPLSVTADNELSLLVDDRHLPLIVTSRLPMVPTTDLRRRSGGLTLDAADQGAAPILDALAAALTADPFIGQRTLDN